MVTNGRLSWRRPVSELLIIVAGVLIALWVENWRQATGDRELEQEYLTRLEADLIQDSIGFDDMLKHVPRTNRAARQLLRLVKDPAQSPADHTSFIAALEEARSIQNNPWTDGTYTELLATGNMSVLRSAELKSKLNVYYLTLEGLYTWVERRVDRSFRDRSASILPPEVREGIYLRHFWSWDSTKTIPDEAWLEEAASGVDDETALISLRSIPEADLMLGRVVDVTSGHLEYLEHARTQQENLLRTVRAELRR